MANNDLKITAYRRAEEKLSKLIDNFQAEKMQLQKNKNIEFPAQLYGADIWYRGESGEAQKYGEIYLFNVNGQLKHEVSTG